MISQFKTAAAILLLAFATCFYGQTAAPGFTLITASHIYGTLVGQLMPTGQITFTPVNNTGMPISFRVGGASYGQMVRTPLSFPIVAGAIVADSTGIAPQLPDTSLTFQ